MSEQLDEDIDVKSSKKKYLTWAIIAIVIVAVIAIPLVIMRQSEPTEATEPATIEQLEAEIDALYVTVYGTTEVEGLETKIAAQTELIANIETGDCVCPVWTGQFSSINSDIATLRTDVDAIVVTDFSANITQIDTDLAALSADLTVVETSLTEIQVQVDAIVVTDWTSDINTLNTNVANIESSIVAMQGQIDSLESAVDLLPTSLPRYAYVTSLGDMYLEIGVIGSGHYPVVVTIYGSDLYLTKAILVEQGAQYGIIGEMVYAVGKIRTLFIAPTGSNEWGMADTITLFIYELTGGIDYATASVGRGT